MLSWVGEATCTSTTPGSAAVTTPQCIYHLKLYALRWDASISQACETPYGPADVDNWSMLMLGSISASMNKPNTLPLNEWVFERSTVMGQVTEVQSDVLMPTLIRYQRILEEVHVVYQIDKTNNAYSRIHMHAKRLAAALEDWRLSVPGGFWDSGSELALLKSARTS